MRRINTGEKSHNIIYEDGEMSVSMKILKARMCQILIENKFFDLRLSKAYFVYFENFGGDRGYEFNVPYAENSHIKVFMIHEKIREYYKGNIEIYLDKDQNVFGDLGFSYKPLDKSTLNCKLCRGKKFVREDGFGYIESCPSCNSNFQLPFNIR